MVINGAYGMINNVTWKVEYEDTDKAWNKILKSKWSLSSLCPVMKWKAALYRLKILVHLNLISYEIEGVLIIFQVSYSCSSLFLLKYTNLLYLLKDKGNYVYNAAEDRIKFKY